MGSGTDYLNLAWDAVLEVGVTSDPKSLEHPHSPDDDVDDMSDDHTAVRRKYDRIHDRAFAPIVRRQLAMGITLLQQGTEFMLKAKIASVSPLLIIAGNVREWPKGCETSDVPFAVFRTVDAQDLPRIHDTVIRPPLTQRFRNTYDHLRTLRNRIVHTVDKKLNPTARDVLVALLEISDALIGPQRWIATRRQYLAKWPDPEFTFNNLLTEINEVVELLSVSECKKFFGFEKRRRSYKCHRCHNLCNGDWAIEWEDDNGLAQLEPHAGSTRMHCIVCGDHYDILRKPCREPNCKGDVIDPEGNVCLVCLSKQAIPNQRTSNAENCPHQRRIREDG